MSQFLSSLFIIIGHIAQKKKKKSFFSLNYSDMEREEKKNSTLHTASGNYSIWRGGKRGSKSVEKGRLEI